MMEQFNIETWREDSKKKEIAAEELDKLIKPGNRVYFGSACSEPFILTKQLAIDQWKWSDCEIIHYFSLSNEEFWSNINPSRLRHNTLSMIGNPKMRNAVNSGKADYTPIMASDMARMLRGIGKKLHIDVALIQVSPPDKLGYCSLGINVDLNRTIVDVAKIVVAQINPQMPRTMGNSFIKFTQIHHFLYLDTPLLEYSPEIHGDSDENLEEIEQTEKIAKFIARLVENESTLNLGLGKIPYTVPKYLKDKKDLAVFSEILPESVIELIENRNITCARNEYPHCMTSLAIGTKKFYDYLNDNPFIEFHTTEYITHVPRIARNTKLCSIYSALKVDVIGQVTNHKEMALHSGMGGEADFMRGANLTEGGKCIVALRSITREGDSCIKPILTTEGIDLRATDVHYIVTEWGIAYLHGKTLRERILQMIGIAHPKFRKELLEQAIGLHFLYEDQKLPMNEDGTVIIIPNIEWYHATKSIGDLKFRPIKPTDERLVQELYYQLSPEDNVMRFFNFRKKFSHKDIQSVVMCDYQNSMVIAGFAGKEHEEIIVALGMYILQKNTGLVEIALTIDKDYRGQGLARHLVLKICELAQAKGFGGICGDVLFRNKAMIHILRTLPYNTIFHGTGESMEFYCKFNEPRNPD
jgi:acyl-CoA hydrolase/GNAT superfamily N-acetyltransferase